MPCAPYDSLIVDDDVFILHFFVSASFYFVISFRLFSRINFCCVIACVSSDHASSRQLTTPDQLIIESCVCPSDNLISLSYSMPAFSVNLFGLFPYSFYCGMTGWLATSNAAWGGLWPIWWMWMQSTSKKMLFYHSWKKNCDLSLRREIFG